MSFRFTKVVVHSDEKLRFPLDDLIRFLMGALGWVDKTHSSISSSVPTIPLDSLRLLDTLTATKVVVPSREE